MRGRQRIRSIWSSSSGDINEQSSLLNCFWVRPCRSKHVVECEIKQNINALTTVLFANYCVDGHACTSNNIRKRMQIISLASVIATKMKVTLEQRCVWKTYTCMFVVFCDCGNTERFKHKVSNWPHYYSDDGNIGSDVFFKWNMELGKTSTYWACVWYEISRLFGFVL
jgi:hypothetical protein